MQLGIKTQGRERTGVELHTLKHNLFLKTRLVPFKNLRSSFCVMTWDLLVSFLKGSARDHNLNILQFIARVISINNTSLRNARFAT